MAFGAFMMIIRSSYYPYLLPLLSMRAFRSQLSFGTATINQITSRMLNSVRIPCPPTELVNEFEGFVTKVDKLRFDDIVVLRLYLKRYRDKYMFYT